MALNANWHKWIRASVYSVIAARLQASLGADFPIYVQEEPERQKRGNQKWIEIRMDGPDLYPKPSEEVIGEVEINLLISRIINEENLFEADTLKGAAANALSTAIPISELGMGGNGSSVGCLQLGWVKTREFGRIEPQTPVQQASVEVRGMIVLTTT